MVLLTIALSSVFLLSIPSSEEVNLMLLLTCSSKLQLQINYVVTYQINLSKNLQKTSQYSIHSLVLNK